MPSGVEARPWTSSGRRAPRFAPMTSATGPSSGDVRARHGILFAFTSWRVGAVALLSFSSGLPLGLVWIAIPTWLTMAGVDLKTVGVVTLAQAPWTFKI